MNQNPAEREAFLAQIEALRAERAALISDNAVTPEDDSPEAIAQAYREQARQSAQLFAEIKGIDDAIAALEAQLRQIKSDRRSLQISTRQQSLKEEVEEGRQQAKIHAERINELASELATEIKALKESADLLSPLYWQVYYKPFITGFQTISVPHVRSDGDVWTIVNRVV
ncbi:MAG: hypothetical protein KME06_04720 [Kastovskya adunca ATA6-11-RM4]|nr:hypothetical protein [Kastovskya adunca ATA6-11-RM4]